MRCREPFWAIGRAVRPKILKNKLPQTAAIPEDFYNKIGRSGKSPDGNSRERSGHRDFQYVTSRSLTTGVRKLCLASLFPSRSATGSC